MSFRTLWIGALCAACGTNDVGVADRLDAARVLTDGTPEAEGVIAMLNDESTTFVVLDVDAALDRRAAANLIAHRDGPDGTLGTGDDDAFDTVDEIDAVPWVGDAALQRLLDYARAEGWVLDDEVYGRIEGVDFTVTQAEATVSLANTAPFEVLDDDVPLDRRAAQGLVDGRPFLAVEEVAEVSYVGTSALTALRDFAATWAPPGPLSTAAAEAALATATKGLWHVSDIDDGLRVVTIPGVSSIDAATAQDVIAGVYEPREGEVGLDDRVVQEVTMARMFDGYTVDDPWWGDEQRAVAPQWRSLRAIFESRLTDPTVLRLGEYALGATDVGGAIDIYVLGTSADGDLVGFHTISVEP